MLNEMMIKCFLSMCQTKNFTHTASELFLSQQAVSQNIAKMEKELGITLFHRNSRGAIPTEYALRYQKTFLWLLNDLAEIRKDIQQSEQAFCEVHIGYQMWLDLGPAPYRTVKQLRQGKTKVRYHIERFSPADLSKLLRTGKISCAIMYERFLPRQDMFPCCKIMDSRHVMLIAMDYPGLTCSSTYLDMRHEPLVFDSLEESDVVKAIGDAKAFCSRIGLSPRDVILKQNRESAYSAVEQGAGVIVTTEVNRILGSAAFAKLPMDSSEAIVAVWNESTDMSLISHYIDTLRRELAAISDAESKVNIDNIT